MTTKVKKKSAKKEEAFSSSEEDEEFILDDDSDMECDIGEEEAECMFCTGLFPEDTSGEQWIQCSKCFKWGHTDCTNAGKKTHIFVMSASMANFIPLS
ncbi:unnamed protein product [Diabrotica balteata]|uniref:PHD-type domain-containing protein n=1 Tax=Diabrotica balteata TaxID=107213 RepID=A0A9N9SPN3_DIABA|nr:unnamed protein product [Diabrotica balteata]